MLTVRTAAHLLLLIFVAGFLFTHSQYFQSLSVSYSPIWQHFFEGGLVGALADWFAVTALFRRPLGIPFPHSAIIVQKQEVIAKQFGVFVEERFLSPEVVSAKIATVNLANITAEFLENDDKRNALASTFGGLIYSLKSLLLSPSLVGLVSKGITDSLRFASFKSLQEALRNVLFKSQNFEPLLDRALKAAQKFIGEEKESLRQRVKSSMPWFVPSFIDDKLYEMLISGIIAWIAEIQSNPAHPFRAKIKEKLEGYVSSDASRVMLENLKNDLLDSKDWQEFLESFFRGITSDETNGTSEEKYSKLFCGYISQMLFDVKQKLKTDTVFQQNFQTIAQQCIITVAGSGRGIIGSLITETLQGWDTKTLVSSIEGSIGADLQYIRINGTVLGSVLGVVLYCIGERY